VGAELRTILHPMNKNMQQKRGVKIVLPDIGKAGNPTCFNESGKMLCSPNWTKSHSHPDNVDFMNKLVKAVSAVPVCSLHTVHFFNVIDSTTYRQFREPVATKP
jgi:hypothetical protein